jgi:hypothetical protein
MSQPDYPVFNKKWQKAQKGWRGGYNFEKSKEYQLAERWFEERKETRKEYNHPTPTNTVVTPVIRMPPGLVKTTIKPKYCKVCNKIPSSLFTSECCNSFFCSDCFNTRAELFNRCPCCKKAVKEELIEQFEGLDLSIPSYDEFYYFEPIEFVPVYCPEPCEIQENSSTPDFVENEQNQQELYLNMPNNDFTDEMLYSFELYMQCLLFSSMLAAEYPNQELQT